MYCIHVQKYLVFQDYPPHLTPNSEPQKHIRKSPVKSRVLDMRTLTTDVRM
jgi:hypothetical protein